MLAVNSRGDRGVPAKDFLADGGVDVQLTEKYLVISDPLIEPLRRLEIAAEWFRVAYRMNKDPRQNPHLYRQLAQVSLLGANFANFRGFSAREAA